MVHDEGKNRPALRRHQTRSPNTRNPGKPLVIIAKATTFSFPAAS
jgi:hypothetical protein